MKTSFIAHQLSSLWQEERKKMDKKKKKRKNMNKRKQCHANLVFEIYNKFAIVRICRTIRRCYLKKYKSAMAHVQLNTWNKLWAMSFVVQMLQCCNVGTQVTSVQCTLYRVRCVMSIHSIGFVYKFQYQLQPNKYGNISSTIIISRSVQCYS